MTPNVSPLQALLTTNWHSLKVIDPTVVSSGCDCHEPIVTGLRTTCKGDSENSHCKSDSIATAIIS